MKIMDESMENEDCIVTTSVPPKKKKLKQARLPFQNLSSPLTPNTLSNKKRKQMSSSPTTFRSPKIVKITSKENADDKTLSDNKNSDNVKSADKTEDIDGNSMETSENSLNKLDDDYPQTDQNFDIKNHDKCQDITKFFIKVNNAETKKNNQPIVLLERCDDDKNDTDEKIHVDEKIHDDEKIQVDEKIPVDDKIDDDVITKEDDSSNEELAKKLDDSDAEEDENSKDKNSEISSDNADPNTDSESERGVSSSDDETDEQKTSTDIENGEKDFFNGKGIDKTPTSSVKAEGANAPQRKLTPKQLEKKLNSTKRREERKKLKLEKEKKREEERLIRRNEKEARRREKKEKEEAEKEQKRKEKEQKELRKQAEIEQKQKEKERRDKAKEEDRRKREEAKEEEKRKKEEDRLEAERKKQKAASSFVSFFVPKKAETKATTEDEKIVVSSNFMPFQVKADMRIAPICRRNLNDYDKTKFDEFCIDKVEKSDNLYVTEIKNNPDKIRKSGKTWPPESKDDDIVVMEDDEVSSCNMVDQTNTAVEKQRVKLLAFAENRRPPYWGTWRKRSSAVTARRPFSKDTKWFDYEVDSDEEWEEEEPGESLRGSDDEKDEENPDDDEYDVDNEFMVPHGYLSDEEAQADEDEEDMSPETQKLKLKILGAEFEEERKTQTSRIKPRVIGPIWQGRDNSYPENVPEKLMEFLMARQAWIREPSIILSAPENNATNANENSASTKANSASGEERRGAKKTQVPSEALPELIRLIHGNPHGLGFLIKEFMTYWNRNRDRDNERPLSKSSLHHKIRELAKRMACPEEGPMHLKACWYVTEDTRKKYLDDEQLKLPNNWTYALTPRRKTLTAETPEVVEKPEKDEREKKNVPLITQYTMKLTQEEMKKQLSVKSGQLSSPKASTSQTKAPKRATLISVGRGEQFPKSTIIGAFTKSTASGATIATTSSADSSTTGTTTKPIVIDLDNENSV